MNVTLTITTIIYVPYIKRNGNIILRKRTKSTVVESRLVR